METNPVPSDDYYPTTDIIPEERPVNPCVATGTLADIMGRDRAAAYFRSVDESRLANYRMVIRTYGPIDTARGLMKNCGLSNRIRRP